MHTCTLNVQFEMNLKNSKETILNQALNIFSRLGFNKTTMADIANASNRGRRTIYTYFKSKEEVFDAVVERELDKVLDLIQQKIKITIGAEKKLLTYIDARLKSIVQLTKYHDALRIAYMQNYRRVEFMRRKLDGEEIIILNEILDLGNTEGVFAIEDVNTTAKNLSIIIRGIEFILIKEDNEKFTELQIKYLQDLFLNGLIKRNNIKL